MVTESQVATRSALAEREHLFRQRCLACTHPPTITTGSRECTESEGRGGGRAHGESRNLERGRERGAKREREREIDR